MATGLSTKVNDEAPAHQQTGMIDVQARRAAAEAQGMIVAAKNFPRDETGARSRLRQSCCRMGLAEESQYSFKKGNEVISGASIHLLKAIAQYWGNIDFGWVEVERTNGKSKIEAYAWDMESNARSRKTFEVMHVRETRSGIYPLTDSRDIYELCANQAARRVRSCLEDVIPADIVAEAVEHCNRTLKGENGEPLPDRINKAVIAFESISVTKAMLERHLQHNLDATTPIELIQLKKLYVGIRDGITTIEKAFPPPEATTDKPAAPKTLDDIHPSTAAAKQTKSTPKETPKETPSP